MLTTTKTHIIYDIWRQSILHCQCCLISLDPLVSSAPGSSVARSSSSDEVVCWSPITLGSCSDVKGNNPTSKPTLVSFILQVFAFPRPSPSGLIFPPSLPPFLAVWTMIMASSSQRKIPGTPRIISSSPTISDSGSFSSDNYFPRISRSTSQRSGNFWSIDENDTNELESSDSDGRARSRSKSADLFRRRKPIGVSTAGSRTAELNPGKSPITPGPSRNKSAEIPSLNAAENGHLLPSNGGKGYWREWSRSPSPLGLIPIHRHWRSFV